MTSANLTARSCWGLPKSVLRPQARRFQRDLLQYLLEETGYFHKETDYRISTLANDIQKSSRTAAAA